MKRRTTLLAAVAGLTGLLLVGEAVARWGLGLGDPPLYEGHPRLEYRLRPNQDVRRFHNRVATNGWGMRSEPLPASRPPGRRRILVFGDSVLFGGSQLDQAEIATERLRHSLSQESGTTVEVGNVSAGSWGPGNWRGWVETYGLLGATDVVLVISSHDARDNPSFGPLDPDHPQRRPASALLELLHRYGWWRWLGHRLPQRQAGGPRPASAAVLRQGLGDLEAFVQRARASGARVSAVQFWERGELERGEPLPDNGRIAAVLRRQGVPAVQAGPLFLACARRAPHGLNDLLVDGIHPFTPAGQACLEEALQAGLQDGLQTGRPAPGPAAYPGPKRP